MRKYIVTKNNRSLCKKYSTIQVPFTGLHEAIEYALSLYRCDTQGRFKIVLDATYEYEYIFGDGYCDVAGVQLRLKALTTKGLSEVTVTTAYV